MKLLQKLALYTGVVAALTIGCGKDKNNDCTGQNCNPTTYQCNDSIDNDGDTLIDMFDPGCSSPADDTEMNTPANQAPSINPKNIIYTTPETGLPFTYTANVTDPDNNLGPVVLELSTDGYVPHIMTETPVGSNNFEYVHTFNDGAVVNARIRAIDSQSLDTVFQLLQLFLFICQKQTVRIQF